MGRITGNLQSFHRRLKSNSLHGNKFEFGFNCTLVECNTL